MVNENENENEMKMGMKMKAINQLAAFTNARVQGYTKLFDAAKQKGWDGAKILIIGSPGSGKTLSLKTINKEAK